MKSKILFATIGFSLIISNAMAEQKASNALLNPAEGVLCDQYVCVDQKGVSKELTEQYLSKENAEKAFSQGEFDETAFTFANGIFCDTNTKLCHVDRYFEADGGRSAVSKEYTEKLFGQAETSPSNS